MKVTHGLGRKVVRELLRGIQPWDSKVLPVRIQPPLPLLQMGLPAYSPLFMGSGVGEGRLWSQQTGPGEADPPHVSFS